MSKKTSLLCGLFGHKAMGSGWWGDSLYGRVVPTGIDNTGRAHFAVQQECPRCGARHYIARFHDHAVIDHIAKHQPKKLLGYIVSHHPESERR